MYMYVLIFMNVYISMIMYHTSMLLIERIFNFTLLWTNCLSFQLINSRSYKELSTIESTATSDLLNQALQRVEELALAVLACQTPEVRSLCIQSHSQFTQRSIVCAAF